MRGLRWLPRPSLRFVPVWRRNLRVWRKLMIASILGNFGEPLLYLLALGYGLGQLIGDVGELSYMAFLASGIVCSSAMFSATFEGLYSAYTRMTIQETWAAMLDAPLEVDDIVLGEILWAATKGLFSAAAILVVAAALGLVADARALAVLPIVALLGFTFGAFALVITALSRSYDYFLYYFTLFVTPMLLLSGVFFPLEQLPSLVQTGAWLLPLAHAVDTIRALMAGHVPDTPLQTLGVLAGYGAAAFAAAVWLVRRRFVGG